MTRQEYNREASSQATCNWVEVRNKAAIAAMQGILSNAGLVDGQYDEGNRVIITISPLVGEEQYCIPKPTIEELKEYNLKINK